MYKKLIHKLLLTFVVSTYAYAGYDYSCFEKPFDLSKNKVAVLDSGYETSHPFLKKNLEKGWNATEKNENVENYFSTCFNASKYSWAVHGTHVAGVITQINDLVRIIPIKISNTNEDENYENALNHVDTLSSSNGNIKLINISGRFYSYESESLIESLAKKGVLLVLAAGNDSRPLDENIRVGKLITKFLKNPIIKDYLVIVGACDYTEFSGSVTQFTRVAPYSNYPESELIKQNFITARGTVESSVPYQCNSDGVEELYGTSMAAPQITAYIFELMERYNISNIKAKKVLFKTAIKENDDQFNTRYTGQGIVNINAAIKYMNEKRNKYFLIRQQEAEKLRQQEAEKLRQQEAEKLRQQEEFYTRIAKRGLDRIIQEIFTNKKTFSLK